MTYPGCLRQIQIGAKSSQATDSTANLIDLDDTLYDGAFYGNSPLLDGALVPIFITRFDDLRHLLGRYHIPFRTTPLAPNDDFPF